MIRFEHHWSKSKIELALKSSLYTSWPTSKWCLAQLNSHDNNVSYESPISTYSLAKHITPSANSWQKCRLFYRHLCHHPWHNHHHHLHHHHHLGHQAHLPRGPIYCPITRRSTKLPPRRFKNSKRSVIETSWSSRNLKKELYLQRSILKNFSCFNLWYIKCWMKIFDYLGAWLPWDPRRRVSTRYTGQRNSRAFTNGWFWLRWE